jgi:hypothetical protein
MGNSPDDGGRPRPEGEGPVAQADRVGQARADDPNTAMPRPTARARPPPRSSRPSTRCRRAGPTRRPRPELSSWGPSGGRSTSRLSRRPGHWQPDGHGGSQREPALGGQHPTEQQGQLSGQDQAQEGRRLQGRKKKEERQAAQPDSDSRPSASCPMVPPAVFLACHATVRTGAAGVVAPRRRFRVGRQATPSTDVNSRPVATGGCGEQWQSRTPPTSSRTSTCALARSSIASATTTTAGLRRLDRRTQPAPGVTRPVS